MLFAVPYFAKKKWGEYIARNYTNEISEDILIRLFLVTVKTGI